VEVAMPTGTVKWFNDDEATDKGPQAVNVQPLS
jgi:cold shock CspA family protein